MTVRRPLKTRNGNGATMTAPQTRTWSQEAATTAGSAGPQSTVLTRLKKGPSAALG